MSDIFGGPPEDEQYDAYGYPLDYAEIEDPYDFWRGRPIDPYWEESITLVDDDGVEHTLSVGDWYSVTMQDPELVHLTYNMDPYEIIMQLQYDYYVWDAEDWETWRDHYESVYG